MGHLVRRADADERGVTIIIVALTLVAMMGMLVLVVDVGGLLFKRRELVNGSDAAALAFAETCASGSTASQGEIDGDQYAAANVAGLTAADGGSVGAESDLAECDGVGSPGSGYVTVQYTSPQRLFFAPVLGFGDDGNVVTKATAAWGSLAGGRIVPIVMQQSFIQSQDCDIPNVEEGQICNLWYDPQTLGASEYGFMNLETWGGEAGGQCPAMGVGSESNAKRSNWILNNFPSSLALKGDPPGSEPTYVCADGGQANVAWFEYLIRRMQADPELLMPVNDCSLQVDNRGNVAPCPANPWQYAIVGFVKLKLNHVLAGNDLTTDDGTPAALTQVTPASTGMCNGEDLGATPGATGWIERDLNALAETACGASSANAVDSISDVVIYSGSGSDRVTYDQCPSGTSVGCDYQVLVDDVTGHTFIRWADQLTQLDPGKKVDLRWHIPEELGGAGLCGRVDERTPGKQNGDPNALCLQLEFVEFTYQGGTVSDAAEDFGVYGYVLCDREIGSCPDQR